MATSRPKTKRAAALAAGDVQRAEELTPPSEKKLTPAEQCGALTRNETACKQSKGSGTDHPGYGNCARHGGNTEAGVKSAMRQMGQDLATRYKAEFLRFGGDRRDPTIMNLTPEQALLEEVRRSAAMVRFLEEKIATWNLQPHVQAVVEQFASAPVRTRHDQPTMAKEIDALFRNVEEGDLPALTTRHPTTGITSFTDAREWLYLYREERGHMARVAKMSIDAGVAARLVSIAEDQGRMLSSAIRIILSALDLTDEQMRRIPLIVPHVLRAVATDSPLPSVPQLLALTQGDSNA